MNKKALITIICIIIVVMAGIFAYKQFWGKKESINNSKSINQGIQDTNTTSVVNNNIGAYVNVESLVDVKMGIFEDGKQKALCTVKIPTNYIVSSLYMDQNGEHQTMSSTNANIVSNVIKNGGFDNPNEIPDTIVLDGEGGNYSFAIGKSDIVSVQSEKEYAPGGIDIVSNSIHKAYIHKSVKGTFDYVFVYDINDKWSLVLQYKGDLMDKISLQKFGQELYKLITTI